MDHCQTSLLFSLFQIKDGSPPPPLASIHYQDVIGDGWNWQWSNKTDKNDVNEGDQNHTYSPFDVFNDIVDPRKSLPPERSHDNDSDREELEEKGGQDDILQGGGQPHQDNSGGLKGRHESEKSLQSPREGDQDAILQSK